VANDTNLFLIEYIFFIFQLNNIYQYISNTTAIFLFIFLRAKQDVKKVEDDEKKERKTSSSVFRGTTQLLPGQCLDFLPTTGKSKVQIYLLQIGRLGPFGPTNAP